LAIELATPNTTAPTVLPDGWRMARFGDMAASVSDRIDNPSEAGVEYYVGLEHLDPESLKIRRWGKPDDVEATKLRFKPGDIIFGRRRAYQRKLAVAEFEGICSAHAMVLRAREDVVLKDFLPFLMQSDMFFDRALQISVGSLSPTINWSALARQEFPLPPLTEQRRIADILWAAEDAFQYWTAVSASLDQSYTALLDSLFDPRSAAEQQRMSRWAVKPLSDVALLQTGLAKGKIHNGQEMLSLPYLRVANVQDGFLDLTEMKQIDVTAEEARRYRLEAGDVLLNEGGDFDKVGRGSVWRGEISPCLHQNHVFVVRPDKHVLLPDFLACMTGSQYGKRYFLSCAKKTSNLASINSKQIKAFPVILPPIDEQIRLLDGIIALKTQGHRTALHLTSLDLVKRTLATSLLIKNSKPS
jgi:type I restriction enzyme, S subunit